jgi:hypothetical protein
MPSASRVGRYIWKSPLDVSRLLDMILWRNLGKAPTIKDPDFGSLMPGLALAGEPL